MNKTTSDSAIALIEHQLNILYPKCYIQAIPVAAGEMAFQKTVKCITALKEWARQGFDQLISWQYATYLYFLSREVVFQCDDTELATKIFLVNKALNSVELFYQVDLPDYFFLSHTPGLVFGKAEYGNFCIFHQGCTVGRSGKDRPTLEPGATLFPQSSVIGRSLVRENTVLTPGVQLVNQDTPGDCYVFTGKNGRPVFKEISEYFADRYFDRTISSS